MTKHVYVADVDVPADHRGLVPCVCGRAKDNRQHSMPAEPPGVAAEQARRIGEK